MPTIRRCAIIGCESHSQHNPELSFFRFPNQTSPYNALWRKACYASMSRISRFKMPHICSLHFERHVITGRRLSTNAIPTRFLDQSPYITTEERRIAYINEVVFEWLLRFKRNNHDFNTLTRGMIKEKAEEAKQIIKCKNLDIDNRWLNMFRKTYLHDFKKRAALTMPLGTTLLVPDIVKALQVRFPMSIEVTADSNAEMSVDEVNSGEPMDAEVADDAKIDDAADNERDDDLIKCFESVEVKENCSTQPATITDKVSQYSKISIKLGTYEEALEYLKPIEDFALREENFRVLNAVAQLETALHKGNHMVKWEIDN